MPALLVNSPAVSSRPARSPRMALSDSPYHVAVTFRPAAFIYAGCVGGIASIGGGLHYVRRYPAAWPPFTVKATGARTKLALVRPSSHEETPTAADQQWRRLTASHPRQSRLRALPVKAGNLVSPKITGWPSGCTYCGAQNNAQAKTRATALATTEGRA